MFSVITFNYKTVTLFSFFSVFKYLYGNTTNFVSLLWFQILATVVVTLQIFILRKNVDNAVEIVVAMLLRTPQSP